MGFSLLEDDVLYKKVVTSSTGHFENGLWIDGEEVILIYTNVIDLKTANDLKGRATNPDIIYLEDPTTDATILDAYEIKDKELWKANKGFSLLGDDYGYYLAIRLGKGET